MCVCVCVCVEGEGWEVETPLPKMSRTTKGMNMKFLSDGKIVGITCQGLSIDLMSSFP